MLDPLTLDQLRILAAVADTGSFSAAARQLGRVQSAVSQSIRTLESALGTAIFDRDGNVPTLNDAGRVILADARRLIDGAVALKARAERINADIEPELTLAVGMGIVVSPLTTAVMNAVPEAKTGAASGVNNSASRLAGVLAVAIVGAVASLVYLTNAPDGAPGFGQLPPAGDTLRAGSEAAFLTSYTSGMAIVAVWALVAAIAAWLWVPKGKPADSAAGKSA